MSIAPFGDGGNALADAARRESGSRRRIVGEKKRGRGLRRVRARPVRSVHDLLGHADDGEHDHEREDDQRLDEGETDDHQNLDATRRARIARRALG